MPSGGARLRSGPAPDPGSFRSAAKDWVTLPAEGFTGLLPVFPLSDALVAELELWAELWRKPQGVMWDKLGMEYQIAAYVRAFLESVEPGAVSGLKTAVLRMEGELGISLPGMTSFHWKFSEDEVAARRPAPKVASSARSRLKAVIAK